MIYEIHISVKLRNGYDEIKWIEFCKETGYKRIRTINNRGKHNIQNMISYHYFCENDILAIGKSHGIEKIIKDAGFDVIRNKVEKYLNQLLEIHYNDNNYTEFHFKVESENDKIKDYSYSINTCSKELYPIITFRIYEKLSLEEIYKYRDAKIDELKNKGLKILGNIHQEFVIFDDYVELDDGWV